MAKRTMSDVLDEQNDFGDNLSLDDVVGKEMYIADFDTLDTQWGPAVKIHVTVDDEDVTVLTWSSVIQEQLHKASLELPLFGTVRKRKNYYTFT